MANTPRTLEITVISGEGLRLNHNRPVKKNAFVIVRADPYNPCTTRMDTEGGSHPSWNEKFVVDVPMHAGFITMEVQCKTSLGNKVVGTARVPASDFVGGYTPVGYLHFLSYRLREANGERNGIINLSVRVKVPEFVGSVSRPWQENPVGAKNYGGAMRGSVGSSMSQPWPRTPLGEKNCGGVVTGVPVWHTCPVLRWMGNAS